MMKKLLCLLAAAMLLLSAAWAEEYQSIADMPTPDRWTETYQAGKFTVAVDVQPTIPEMESLPVLKVVPSYWVPQAREDAQWQLAMDRTAEGAFHLWTENVETFYDPAVMGILTGPFDRDAKYITGSELTVNQMAAKVAQIFSEMENPVGYDIDHIDSLNPQGAKGSTAVIMSFFQTLRDVPLWGHAIYSVDNASDSDMAYAPNFILTMQDDDHYELLGRTVSESAVLAEDVPLCSFDKIKATVEEQIRAKHIRAVYAIDLGYALYNEPGVIFKANGSLDWQKTAEFYAVPAWRVVCLYTSYPTKTLPESAYADPVSSLYYETLYISAQTGELLDPDHKGKGGADYEGFIAWDDVK